MASPTKIAVWLGTGAACAAFIYVGYTYTKPDQSNALVQNGEVVSARVQADRDALQNFERTGLKAKNVATSKESESGLTDSNYENYAGNHSNVAVVAE